MKPQIIPIIMTESIHEVERKVVDLNSWNINTAHIDILDGVFADNLTVGVSDLRDVDFSSTAIELHLMTEEPVDYLGEISLLKSPRKRVYGHIERMGNLNEFIELGRELNTETGWALDIYTPLESLQPQHLLKADGVLLMSIKTGYSGQTFNTLVLEKIRQLRLMGFSQDIEIDGGVNASSIPKCLSAGANLLAINSAIWQSDNPIETYHQLNKLL